MLNIIKIEEMLNNKNKNDFIKSQHKSLQEKKKSQEVGSYLKIDGKKDEAKNGIRGEINRRRKTSPRL